MLVTAIAFQFILTLPVKDGGTLTGGSRIAPRRVEDASTPEDVLVGHEAVIQEARAEDTAEALENALKEKEWDAAYAMWCRLRAASEASAAALAERHLGRVEAAMTSSSEGSTVGWDDLYAASIFAGVPRATEVLRLAMGLQPGVAAQIESLLWMLWCRSGDESLDEWLVHAIKQMQTEEEYAAALVSLDALVHEAPWFAEAWNRRATLFYLMGRHEESLADCATTLKLNPSHFGALGGSGLVRLAVWRINHDWAHLQAAHDAFEALLELYPHNGAARANLPAIKQLMSQGGSRKTVGS